MEELCILALLACEEEKNEEKRMRRTIIRNLRNDSDPFSLSEEEFMKNFRLTRTLCRQLIEDLAPHDSQQTSLPLTIRVLTALNFLGHGSYQKCVGNNCNLPMSQPSVSRSIRSVTELIIKAKACEVKFPSTVEEENATKAGFFRNFGIKSTIGAIDCTHVAIIAPPSNNPRRPLNLYMNRKGFYSINVEAVCDHRLVFTYINSNYPGATHDSGIWTTSDLRAHLIRSHIGRSHNREECWLIGDQGYPLEPWLLTPIANPNNSKENKYNRMHASARNCVERAFGVLKTRFRCLLKHRVLHYSHEIASNIIESCVILHNMILRSGPAEIAADEDFFFERDETEDTPNTSTQYTNEGVRIRSRYVSTL